MSEKHSTTAGSSQAGWEINSWIPEAGLRRATYYLIEPECQPRKVYVGCKPIIVESPRDYLARIERDFGGQIKLRKAGKAGREHADVSA